MDNHTIDKMRSIGAIAVLVIAVLTIFFVFLHQRERKDMSIKLRLFFSDMSQTIQYAMTSNGPPGEWGWNMNGNNYNLITSNITSNLRLSRDCLQLDKGCFIKDEYKNFRSRSTGIKLNKLPSVIMQNGIAIAFNVISDCKKEGQQCAFLYVDLNGYDKPNVFGKDLFVFLIVNSRSIAFLPYNLSIGVDALASDIKFGCNKNSKIPMYCSGLLYTKNWNIDSKYPW